MGPSLPSCSLRDGETIGQPLVVVLPAQVEHLCGLPPQHPRVRSKHGPGCRHSRFIELAEFSTETGNMAIHLLLAAEQHSDDQRRGDGGERDSNG